MPCGQPGIHIPQSRNQATTAFSPPGSHMRVPGSLNSNLEPPPDHTTPLVSSGRPSNRHFSARATRLAYGMATPLTSRTFTPRKSSPCAWNTPQRLQASPLPSPLTPNRSSSLVPMRTGLNPARAPLRTGISALSTKSSQITNAPGPAANTRSHNTATTPLSSPCMTANSFCLPTLRTSFCLANDSTRPLCTRSTALLPRPASIWSTYSFCVQASQTATPVVSPGSIAMMLTPGLSMNMKTTLQPNNPSNETNHLVFCTKHTRLTFHDINY